MPIAVTTNDGWTTDPFEWLDLDIQVQRPTSTIGWCSNPQVRTQKKKKGKRRKEGTWKPYSAQKYSRSLGRDEQLPVLQCDVQR